MSYQPLIPTTQSTQLLPANLDLEHVSQYNDHGKALAIILDEHKIHDRHYPFVLGLFAVYNLLVSLGHFTSANIFGPRNLYYLYKSDDGLFHDRE
jgi:hypothetical protein